MTLKLSGSGSDRWIKIDPIPVIYISFNAITGDAA
jgi:hypothetical protein